MSRGHRYVLGKVDHNGSGRKNCKAVITWTLEDGNFSMCAEIWNPRETDIYCGGQCVDTVAAYFPGDAKAQRMVAIWRKWHLNDLTAGSPAQEAWLEANPIDMDAEREIAGAALGGTGAYPHGSASRGASRPKDRYTLACEKLAAVGLNPDPGYLHNGEPYSYGHAWLCRELPAEVVAEIESWSA